MKKTNKILIAIAIVLVVSALVKDPIIKAVVISQAKSVLGVQVQLDGLGIGLFSQSVRIKGLKVYNPPGFPNEIMMDIPQISVDYDVLSLLKGMLHLPLVIVDMKELVVIRNKEGKLNVDSLKVAQKGKEAPEQPKEEKKDPSQPMAMQMDQVTLNLGKVIVKDYSRGGEEPTIQAYDIGVKNKTFKNIKSAEQFAALVLVQAMGPTALRNAAIYGAASILGAGFLPAGIAGAIWGKDGGTAEFNAGFDKVYGTALEVTKKSGQVAEESKALGIIKGKINGANIVVNIIKEDRNKTKIAVTARKFMMPKPEIAEGVIYQISEALVSEKR